jgi:hypothetical protein
MRRYFIAALFAMCLASGAPCVFASGSDVIEGVKEIKHAWATPRMKDIYWAIDFGDPDGDGEREAVLATRGRVEIGNFSDKGFAKEGSCELPEVAQAVKVYLKDVDGNPGDEIIVSAVENGEPASAILKYDGKSCSVLAKDINLFLRKTSPDGAIVSQMRSMEDFFSGAIYALDYIDGKLKKSSRLDLPWRTKIYQFSMLPDSSVMMQEGYAPLQIKSKMGKNFKRTWRSSERFGGSVNVIPAESRRVMGSAKSEYAIFDVPPIVIDAPGGTSVIAVKNIMPLKGMVGDRPYVDSAEFYIFKRDAALGLLEMYKSVRLPGPVADMAIVDGKTLYLIVHPGSGYFLDDKASEIFAFDIGAL